MVGGGGFWPVMLFFLSRAGKGGVSERLASEVRLVCPLEYMDPNKLFSASVHPCRTS